jgi:hypothetical protein
MKTLNKLYSIAKEFVKEYESNIKEMKQGEKFLADTYEKQEGVEEKDFFIIHDTEKKKNKHNFVHDMEKVSSKEYDKFSVIRAKSSPVKEFSTKVILCLTKCLEFFPEHLHPKNKKTWLSVIEKLHRIDKVPYEEIVRLTELARKDSFWSKNFLSLTKLRMKDKQKVMYIVVFSEKFKAKEKLINRQSQAVIEKNLTGWGKTKI